MAPRHHRLSMDIAAPPDDVWRELADLASHSEWMADAAEIKFETNQTSGVGTRMRVPTRVGPLRTNDLMTVIDWVPGKTMTVRHEGAVVGTGRFELQAVNTGTRLIWTEQLVFPWWLGGPLGVTLAGPILKRIWRGNLSRLRDRVVATDR